MMRKTHILARVILNSGQKLPILALCAGFAFFLTSSATHPATTETTENPGMLVDFIEYWASARLLLSGQNPYSLSDLLSLQKTVGWTASFPHIMWNPPWTLAFLIPFGWLSFSTALQLWFGLLSATVLFCSTHLWRLYGGPTSRTRLVWFVTLTFAPTVFALLLQQISTLTLLGMTGFLHFERQKSHKMAGASLVLVALKPHLYLLFWVVLLLWTLDRRRWDVLLGFTLGMLSAAAIPTALDYRIFNEFVQLYLTAPYPRPFDQETPTLARALWHWVDMGNPLPQILPASVGVIWSVWYWHKHKSDWNWLSQVPLLLLVSVTTNFFAWSADQIILLPALLQCTQWILDAGYRTKSIVIVILYVLAELAVLMVKFFTPHDFWYFWLSLVWCSMYLVNRQTMRTAWRTAKQS